MISVTMAGSPSDMPLAAADAEIIETRFGTVSVQKSKAIVFPAGILGMPDRYNFCVTEMPSEKLQQFKLLQSLDDTGLSFITLPLGVDNPIIDRADIEEACTDLGFDAQETALLLIVSVHRSPQSVKLSVNARAPLIVDASRRMAVQHVFHNEKYKVQFVIQE